jgi:hypothetical protein
LFYYSKIKKEKKNELLIGKGNSSLAIVKLEKYHWMTSGDQHRKKIILDKIL